MKRTAIVGFTLAAVAAFTGLVAASGYRMGLLSTRTALLNVLPWGAYLGAAATAVSAVALVGLLIRRKRPTRGLALAAIGVILGTIAWGVPGIQRYRINRDQMPPIHDISTDTDDPPLFVDVLPLRVNAPNTTEYGGATIAAQQHKAYPDLKPVVLNMAPRDAFDRALATVNEMGWDLVSANRDEHRIEATDTTFWFGFKDDVVIRLRPTEGGTRVDVRSLSRVGGGDVGTNARRIRTYIAELTGR